MQLDATTTAIVTGASRGLGRHITRALAQSGVSLVLAARSAPELEAEAEELRRTGVAVHVRPTDVAHPEEQAQLVAFAQSKLGHVDVLVNNAGVEQVERFEGIDLARMRHTLGVNLVAPMALTRLVLPGMLAQQRGHIVNIASLAGKSGPPHGETYAASKAGLIGFTQSLRASYAGTGVSASAVCPGFVADEGMFADRARAAGGIGVPKLLGQSRPEAVGEAVVAAIEDDAPEMLVNPGPTRLLMTVAAAFPRMPGWLIRRMGLRDLYEKAIRPH